MTQFHVWAPAARDLAVVTGDGDQTYPMRRGPGGWWAADVAEAGHGTDYAFVLDGGEPTPDPRSLWQPRGVDAASRVYEHDRFAWSDSHWRGLALPGAVLTRVAASHLRVGTFQFFAARGQLDMLPGDGKLVQLHVGFWHEVDESRIQTAGSYGF